MNCIDITKKYITEVESIKTRPGCWDYLNVSIFLIDGDSKIKIGEYQRNYSNMYNTFYPFVQNGKEYALYSTNYTATRIMTLPGCKDLCGEEQQPYGFCPTGYYVPVIETDCEEDYNTSFDPKGMFGFVCGCVWGDDSSWKIQYLDLSKIEQGILTRDERFGYIELLGDSKNLKNSIDLEYYDEDYGRKIKIACARDFYLDKFVEEKNEN